MAAGRGTRLGADRPKALVLLDGTPLVTHALRGVLSCPGLTDVVVVAPPDRMPELTDAVRLAPPSADTGGPQAGVAQAGVAQVKIQVVPGGAERTDSVAAGLRALPSEVGIVLVHDAARALTPNGVFERVVTAVRHGHPAVIPVLPVTDTIKSVDSTGHVTATPDRRMLRAVQTPQGFLRETLERAHREAGAAATDDAGLVEMLGSSVFVVDGDPQALKVTSPQDLAVAASWVSAPDAPAQQLSHPPVLLVLAGLPGTGKITVARAWARARGAAHVRVDTVEQAIVSCGSDDDQRATVLGPEGYAAAYSIAADQLRVGLDVVADSVNPLPQTREAWRGVAHHAGARLLEVQLTCAAPEHRERVEGREADIVGHNLPDWAAVQSHDYAPWIGWSIDTSGRDVSDIVREIEMAEIERGLP